MKGHDEPRHEKINDVDVRHGKPQIILLQSGQSLRCLHETKLPRNVIEKDYTWVDVKFLIFSQFACHFNVYFIYMYHCFKCVCTYVIKGHLEDSGNIV